MNTEELAVLEKALSEHGASLKTFSEAVHAKQEKLAARLLELEQKLDKRPGVDVGNQHRPGELADLLMKSEALATFKAGNSPKVKIEVPAQMFKSAILNASPLDNNQPLVAPQRAPGIVTAPQRRLTIRDLFMQLPTASNLVDFTRELSFTNNAAPQGTGSSPAETEGQLYNESGMAFELANTPVITLAHWIPASRQVLDDAPALQQHVENRLLYGLKLEEEDELLNGVGTNGKLDGLIHNATAFDAGSTNLTALDAVALGIGQLVGSNFEPSGIVVNPADWYSAKFLLAKTTYGEYLLGDPASMAQPRLFGLPTVVTPTCPAGNFMVLDAARAGYIADREDAVIRVADQHADFAVRGLVAIICEERLAIVVQQGAAMVYGTLNFAG